MALPVVHWLWVAMYRPEFFIWNDVIRGLDPPREVLPAPPPGLYNIAEDPLERENLAEKRRARARRLPLELENWFEEADRATVADVW